MKKTDTSKPFDASLLTEEPASITVSIDCYVLSPSRSTELALKFLDYFCPNPQFSAVPEDPQQVLGLREGTTWKEALVYLEQHDEGDYTFYFSSDEEQGLRNALMAYNADGSLILGTGIGESRKNAWFLIEHMKEVFGSKAGLFLYDAPPPMSEEEFLQVAKDNDTSNDPEAEREWMKYESKARLRTALQKLTMFPPHRWILPILLLAEPEVRVHVNTIFEGSGESPPPWLSSTYFAYWSPVDGATPAETDTAQVKITLIDRETKLSASTLEDKSVIERTKDERS